MEILRTENLKIYFRQVRALDGVDISLKEGMTTSLTGESGCGKSTLARAILGFYKPNSGKIYFKDADITLKNNETVIRNNIQIVFQNPFLSFDPRYTVFSSFYEVMAVSHMPRKRQAESDIAGMLEEVELDAAIMNRYPHQLSGGQLQRAAIARSLINDPKVVILDEPVSSLDITTSYKIVMLFKKLQESRKVTFLFISHNLKLTRKTADFCFIMYCGKIVESGPRESVYSRPAHPYTRLLMEASDYSVKEASSYNNAFFSGGCIFQGRCPIKNDYCNSAPPKNEIEEGHFVFCHNPGPK